MGGRTRRRPSGRATPRRRPVATRGGRPRGGLVEEARSLISDGMQVVHGHATKVRCPHCKGLPLVKQKDWPAHRQMHKLAGRGRPVMTQPANGGVAPAPAPAPRPKNPQANPGGRFTPTRPGSPHSGDTPPTVKYVDDDGNRIDWSPGDPLPTKGPPERPEDVWRLGTGIHTSWLAGVGGAIWEWFSSPFRTKARRATSDGGKRWKARTHNPGGTPVGGGQPAVVLVDGPPMAPVIPITTPAPTAPPVAPTTGTSGGGTTVAGPRGAGGSTKPKARGTGGSGGAGGAQGIAEGGRAWANSPPETLAEARQDAQNITEGLAGLADALLQRMNAETERSIAHECVEPYNAAAQSVRQAAEHCQEVFAKLTQRYGHLAEELAKPDTPHPEYLMEGKG